MALHIYKIVKNCALLSFFVKCSKKTNEKELLKRWFMRRLFAHRPGPWPCYDPFLRMNMCLLKNDLKVTIQSERPWYVKRKTEKTVLFYLWSRVFIQIANRGCNKTACKFLVSSWWNWWSNANCNFFFMLTQKDFWNFPKNDLDLEDELGFVWYQLSNELIGDRVSWILLENGISVSISIRIHSKVSNMYLCIEYL